MPGWTGTGRIIVARLHSTWHFSWAAWTVEIMVPQTGLDLIDKKDSSSGLPRRRRSLRPSPQCRFYKRNVVYKVQRAHLLWYNETKALRWPDLNLSQWPHLLFRWRRLGEEGHILQGGVGTGPVQPEVVKVRVQVASHIIFRHYRCRWRAVKSRTDLPVRLFTVVTIFL